MAQTSSGNPMIRVWDLPVRLFHWGLVALLILLYLSGERYLGLTNADHQFLGKLTLALIVFRVIWGFVGSDTARFSNFVKGLTPIFAYLDDIKQGRHWAGVGHNPVGALMMITLMTLVFVAAVTGLMTVNTTEISWDGSTDGPLAGFLSPETAKTVAFVHRNLIYVICLLALAHIGAAFFYKYVKKDDIITPMLTGVEPQKPGTVQPRFVSNWYALGIFAISCALVWFVIDMLQLQFL